MPPVRRAARNALLQSLVDANAQHPTTYKHLVAPDINCGRELLVSLARETGAGWIGWHATSLRRIADDLALVPLSERGRRIGADVQIDAAVDTALDDFASGSDVSESFRELARVLGMRRAVRNTILELRMAGVTERDLRRVARPATTAAHMASILARYERLLETHHLADAAEVFHAALGAWNDESQFALGDDPIFLVPGLRASGLPGRLLQRLITRGARVLEADIAVGAPVSARTLASRASSHEATPLSRLHDASWFASPPQDGAADLPDWFAAASPIAELREVLRRGCAEGWRWEEIEIVTTDPDAYGVALDSLGQRLDIGATMSAGVPLAGTRIGRALERWMEWISTGLPADLLREALESGELASPDRRLASSELARALRRTRIGWGRARWEVEVPRLKLAERANALTARKDESEEQLSARRSRIANEDSALGMLLEDILTPLPRVPERGKTDPIDVRVSSLAAAAVRYLDALDIHEGAETLTENRVRERLMRITDVHDAPVPFALAMATLRDALSDLRAWPQITSASRPWQSSGGRVHLTDVAHAGMAGRPRTFVVGLDVERTAGPSLQNALIGDDLRAALGGALPTTADQRQDREAEIARGLAALRGKVTLSYAVSGNADGRETSPAPELLQLFRMVHHRTDRTYRDLRRATGSLACAVPTRAAESLDQRDLWLNALADGPLLLDGRRLVRRAHRPLDDGLTTFERAGLDLPSPVHGIVPRQGERLPDEIAAALTALGATFSASALEALASCPMRWLYKHGIGLRLPDDPTFEAGAWLNAAQRGTLLHRVFERVVVRYLGRQDEIADRETDTVVRAIVDEECDRMLSEVPAPSQVVLDTERAALVEDALEFLGGERRAVSSESARWIAAEIPFGDGPLTVTLDGQSMTLKLRGRIDRVDELRDGRLRIIDYKTGVSTRFEHKKSAGAFRGGRHLQAAVYAAAASQLDGLRDKVIARFEYRFPTVRGEGKAVVFDLDEIGVAGTILRGLLAHLEHGEFPPTTDSGDCRFCDYANVCRVRVVGEFDTVISPRADWAKDHKALPIYSSMCARRGAEQ